MGLHASPVGEARTLLAGLLAIGISAIPCDAKSPGTIPTDPNLKVAFIGDTGDGADFRRVLQLIASEGAHIVMHQGDFDYHDDADGFFATIDSILGPNFPFFASVGNHDIASWPTGCGDPDGCYAQFLLDRMARIGVAPDDPNLNDQMYAVEMRGLKMVFVGQDGVSAGDNTYAPYIEGQLSADDHLWKICSWHKNQTAMQIGHKPDEMGWRVYEACKDLGAIIATAHEHSYHRTRTLTSLENQVVDSSCSDPKQICLAKGNPGKSFVFVSGLGGRSIADQERCLPTTFPYGCNGEWATIYSSDQGAQYGALFITFHVDGDPYLARGYFKNIDGGIIDEFDINPIAARNPLPALSSLIPSVLPAGTPGFTLTVTGSGFVPASVVQWNGSNRPTNLASRTELRASIPAGDIDTVGTAEITVSNPGPAGGTSDPLPFTIIFQNPLPTLGRLSPASAVAGEPGFMLAVTGSGFVFNSVLRWDGSDRLTSFVSGTRLLAAIPATDILEPGDAAVTVFNPGPGGGSSNLLTFSVTSAPKPAPAIDSIVAASIGIGSVRVGPTLTSNGTDIPSSSRVRGNGGNRVTPFASARQLRGLIPVGDLGVAGTTQITVFNPNAGGGSSNPLSSLYHQPLGSHRQHSSTQSRDRRRSCVLLLGSPVQISASGQWSAGMAPTVPPRHNRQLVGLGERLSHHTVGGGPRFLQGNAQAIGSHFHACHAHGVAARRLFSEEDTEHRLPGEVNLR